MNNITISSFEDNSFYISYGDFRCGSVAWSNHTNSWHFSDCFDNIIHLGNEPLPDWTSLIQYLQEND